MRSGILLTCAALLLACATGFAQQKASFTGTWTLDKEKSFSNGPQFEQTLTIQQNGDHLKMHAKQKTPRGEVTIDEEFSLDGKAGEFTPQGAAPNSTGRRKAIWLGSGRTILVEDEISVDGKVSRNVARKMSLSADGRTMTVDIFLDDNRGSFELKRVYNKAM
ncbi:MAG: hypothetical protein ACKVX9_17470 [Blastocatellia bacterium]